MAGVVVVSRRIGRRGCVRAMVGRGVVAMSLRPMTIRGRVAVTVGIGGGMVLILDRRLGHGGGAVAVGVHLVPLRLVTVRLIGVCLIAVCFFAVRFGRGRDSGVVVTVAGVHAVLVVRLVLVAHCASGPPAAVRGLRGEIGIT